MAEAAGSVLLIDNYDSFTFNLQHLLAVELGELPTVCRNDEIPFDALRRGEFRALVISPGPGRPDTAGDFGGCREAILEFDLPILGVCLGHQGIATAFGGAVEPAPAPVHGEATEIGHDRAAMFAGLPRRFEAVRYHSLVVAEPLPDCLEVTARAGDGSVMALAHRERPIWGVQFHPESIATRVGGRIIRNFVAAAGVGVERNRRQTTESLRARAGVAQAESDASATWEVVVRELERVPDPGRAFAALFGAERDAFWLDDASGGGRTFMGCSTGPAAEVLRQGRGAAGSIFDLLRARLRERRLTTALPFDFPGYVGYFGYGLKRTLGSSNRVEADTPDALFIAATEVVVFDHRSGQAFVLGLLPPEGPRAATEARVEDLRARLERMSALPPDVPGAGPLDAEALDWALDRPAYLDAIATAQRELVAGESYELCLTNQATVEVGGINPLELFTRQRALNPAPFGAFLRCGDLAVLSSSPERFLRIAADGEVEARPVKGTRARGTGEEDRRLREELRGSVKDRAENLMIVDLLRNDLNRVCEVGSVEVGELFGLETHPHVHQLVSTVRGRLRAECDPLGAVEACFPGGSMTGAPKLRSMQILDRLEPVARGIYSGALGYLGLGGEVDFSIVIRTAVLRDGLATVGSGGAITVRSEPEEEWEEMLVKARPTLAVLGAGARRSAALR
jgi:para-aminobenzoate synthetase